MLQSGFFTLIKLYQRAWKRDHRTEHSPLSGPLGLGDFFDDKVTSTEFLIILYGDLTIRA